MPTFGTAFRPSHLDFCRCGVRLLVMWAEDPIYGCWIWEGQKTKDGYGTFKGLLAHRVVWERERGALGQGQELDHLCRRRACVRPSHLEPVTQRENKKRMWWRARAAPKTCSKGHDFWTCCRRTPEGGYSCRKCDI